MKKGRGLGKKTGGRGDGDIRDFFFDAFRNKRPHAANKVPLMLACDSEGKIDQDGFMASWLHSVMASCVKIYYSIFIRIEL